jgi:hypothetical protein
VETSEGRRAYALEQEALSALAVPVRARLLEAYDAALLQLSTPKCDTTLHVRRQEDSTGGQERSVQTEYLV